MISQADHADACVLVSGDGDYMEAVKYLQSKKGLHVEVVSAGQCTSQALLDICDSHTDLGDIPNLFRRPSKAVNGQHSAISPDGSPSTLTSVSRSMSSFSRTVSRASSMSARASFAVPPPWFTK